MNQDDVVGCLDFLRFLHRHGTLRHGSFRQRSGRLSPFIFDLSQLDSALAVSRVGQRLALLIDSLGGADVICGPAYSGIPLALAAAIEYGRLFNESVRVLYARKQSKRYVEDRLFDGPRPSNGDRVVLVDEVIASGRTLDELIFQLDSTFRIVPEVAVVCVDRQEKGFRTQCGAAAELREFRNVDCYSLTNAESLLCELSVSDCHSGLGVEPPQADRIRSYYSQYGAPNILGLLPETALRKERLVVQRG